MKHLVAKKQLDYSGNRYSAGARFDATSADARILTVTGLATLADIESPATAESPSRRRYKRRDMQAEA